MTVHTEPTLTLGSDLPVKRMGFGAMRITGPGVWGEPPDKEAAKTLLLRVLDLGINLIDTADAYGPEVSENLIKDALHPYPEGLVIATKGGLVRPGPGEWQPKGHPDYLRTACEGSLKRLKLDQIDLYQFHAPDPNVPFEDSVGTLADLQKEGKIRYVGLSNVSVTQLESARKIVDVVSVQNRYNLTDRTHEPVLKACEAAGIGFIPWYPLATGKLAEGHGPLADIASKYEATTSQVALAWLLGRSPVNLPIPGTSSVAHLEENTAARDVTLSEDDIQALDAAV